MIQEPITKYPLYFPNAKYDPKYNTITPPNKIVSFKYESNIEENGWWNKPNYYPRTRYYAYLAEIAGYQLSSFKNVQDFDKAIEHACNENWRLYSIVKNRDTKWRLPRDSKHTLDAVRKLRGQMIGRIITCFDALKHLRRITGNLLPEFINRMILVEFLGLDTQIGCLHCQRANYPLDSVITHQSKTCPFYKLKCAGCGEGNV